MGFFLGVRQKSNECVYTQCVGLGCPKDKIEKSAKMVVAKATGKDFCSWKGLNIEYRKLIAFH